VSVGNPLQSLARRIKYIQTFYSRECGLSQVSPDLTRGREVGGVFRVTGFFATAVSISADDSTDSPFQVRARVVGLSHMPSLVLTFSRRTYEGFPRLF